VTHCIHLHCKYSLISLISFDRNKTAVKFEVLTVVLMQPWVFRGVTLCRCVRGSQFFKMPGTTEPVTQHRIPQYLNLQQNCCSKLIFLCKSACGYFQMWTVLRLVLATVLYAAVSWCNLSCKSPTWSRGIFTPEQSCLETAYIKNLPYSLCWVRKWLINGCYVR